MSCQSLFSGYNQKKKSTAECFPSMPRDLEILQRKLFRISTLVVNTNYLIFLRSCCGINFSRRHFFPFHFFLENRL